MKQLGRWVAVAVLMGAAPCITLAAVTDPVPPVFDGAATQEFIIWARRHAVSVGDIAQPPGQAEAVALQEIIGDARVVLLGEPTHCTVEPVAIRNRLFRHLIERQYFTAVALETGSTQARAIDEFIDTGIGDVNSLVLGELTWGFGNCAGNLQLIEWLRDYNAMPAHRKIHFYGIDVPAGDASGGMTRAHEVIDAIVTSLRTQSGTINKTASVLSRFSSDFTPEGYRSWGTDERIEFIKALNRAEKILRSAHHESDSFRHAWELRNVDAARSILEMYSVWPADFKPAGPIPPSFWRADQIRDRTMSENVQWALKQEGPGGRLLVFAHDGHIQNAHVLQLTGNFYPILPEVMGQLVKAKLGPAVSIIGISASSGGPGLSVRTAPKGSVEATLAKIGTAPAFIGLHGAPAWAFAEQTMNNALTRTLVLSPGTAFDALYYVDVLHQGWSNAGKTSEP